MTSDQLAGVLSGYKSIGGVKHQFTPDEVYFAASLAQNEILSEKRLLERTVRLALVDGQAEYQFPPATIENAYTESPIRLKLTGHSFNTNDEVVVAGALGMTEANGRYYATKVDADHISLQGTTGTTAWTGGGTVYHALHSALEIKAGGIRKVSDADGTLYGTLTKKSQAEFEQVRQEFQALDTPAVIYFMEEYTDPLTIKVMGTPPGDILTEVSFYSKALPSEDITETVSPMLPTQYDQALIAGAWYWMLSLRHEPELSGAEDRAFAKYEILKTKAGRIHGRAKRIVKDDFTGIKF
jgi:hypothetical protein